MGDTDSSDTDRPGNSIPDPHTQVLEAARDDPSRSELTNMVFNLDSVHFVSVQCEDEPHPTVVDVHLNDDHGRQSGAIMDIMRAAGWTPSYVAFSRNRITFEEANTDV